jgi:hypothetical protein
MIECCGLLALAGQRDKCDLIASGVDVYRDMAALIYGLDRDAFLAIPEELLTVEQGEQRRVGKNGVLSCGYQISAEPVDSESWVAVPHLRTAQRQAVALFQRARDRSR